VKLALVITRTLINPHKERYFGSPCSLSEILFAAGHTPIFIGYEKGSPLEIVSKIQPSVCILNGGESIGENLVRDNFELGLLRACEEQSIPVIGICRGMQLMSSFMGKQVVPIESHSGTEHEVNGELKFKVHSYHNNALFEAPENFRIDYLAKDGSIEAFSNRVLRWHGTMWHPEREEPDSPGYRYIMDLLEKI
jgi:gamma-glutamyl-gamma-aminobutyrate hydrolase PuuD